jgi:carbamoyl-phosphate synthase large subunit
LGIRQDLDIGLDTFNIKAPVFPFGKFPGVDVLLGPEMKSTGEVMGTADNFGEAFAKAQLAAGNRLPTRGTVFISVTDRDKPQVVEIAKRFVELGFKLVATTGTAKVLEDAGLFDEKAIRRAAVTHQVQCITTLAAARAAADGIAALQQGQVSVHALQALHAQRAVVR